MGNNYNKVLKPHSVKREILWRKHVYAPSIFAVRLCAPFVERSRKRNEDGREGMSKRRMMMMKRGAVKRKSEVVKLPHGHKAFTICSSTDPSLRLSWGKFESHSCYVSSFCVCADIVPMNMPARYTSSSWCIKIHPIPTPRLPDSIVVILKDTLIELCPTCTATVRSAAYYRLDPRGTALPWTDRISWAMD